MNLIIAKNYELMSRFVAKEVIRLISKKPEMLICAATGATPLRTYKLLAKKKLINSGFFNKLTIVKLDEWGGIPLDNPATCETYLKKYLIGPLRIPVSRYFGFDSNPINKEKECLKVKNRLSKLGNIDLLILGLGVNGHLGFNEPSNFLKPYAHIAKLSNQSLSHPMVKQIKEKIKYGLTLGMADILQSQKIILMVSGKNKRKILNKLLSSIVTPNLPASILWLHSNVILICDSDALPKKPKANLDYKTIIYDPKRSYQPSFFQR